jgi:prepilin-type N-terminal cleavage/methylation domain-containing protein
MDAAVSSSSSRRGKPPRLSRARSKKPGFTLIEVLATLLLLSIVLPVIMMGFSISSQAVTMARHRSEAGALAESKLNELVATGLWQSGAQNGTFDTSPDYQWSASPVPWGEGQGVQGANYVQELDVTVTWNTPTPQSITVSTLVYQSANATATGGITGGLP